MYSGVTLYFSAPSQFCPLTGQATRQPRFIADLGVNRPLEDPQKSGRLCHFVPPIQHRGGIGTYRPYLVPPYRTMTHPVVEVSPIGRSAQLGQAQAWGVRLPQRVP